MPIAQDAVAAAGVEGHSAALVDFITACSTCRAEATDAGHRMSRHLQTSRQRIDFLLELDHATISLLLALACRLCHDAVSADFGTSPAGCFRRGIGFHLATDFESAASLASS